MSKYIPAEKLIAEIKRLKGLLIRGACAAQMAMETNCKDEAYNEVLSFVTTLQQEQPDIIEHICLSAGISAPFMDGNQWSILKGDNIQVGVVGFGDTKEDALINFIKDIPIQQEQPEGDLEKEMDKWLDAEPHTVRDTARHFYELGLNAGKK